MDENFIKRIMIRNIWNRYDMEWNNLNRDVNILVGINGSGKTTVFRIINALLKNDTKTLKKYGVSVDIELDQTTISYTPKTSLPELKKAVEGVNFCFIATFDTPYSVKNKRIKEYSQLYNQLHNLVYDIGGSEPSFSDYRLKATNFPEKADYINQRIKLLFDTINRLVEGTGKVLSIDPLTNHLVFDDGGEKIELYQLSSGEKQLLLILIKVFLMDEMPYILFMDEPEISLHIEWQHRLFEEIRLLNPRCQIITSTHSPSLFGDGWEEKLVFVNEMFSVKS